MSVKTVSRHPCRLSGFMAIMFGALSIGLILNSQLQYIGLGIEIGGILLVFLGLEVKRAGHGIIGAIVLFAGLGVAMVGIVFAVIQAPRVGARTEVIPGLVGLVLLSAGSLKISTDGYARALPIIGTGLLVISVLISGILIGTPQVMLLGATAAAIVAWDVGEQGINLPQQVGRSAKTRRVELLHMAGSVMVGLVAIGVAYGFSRVEFGQFSVTGLFLLLGASVILIVALYN